MLSRLELRAALPSACQLGRPRANNLTVPVDATAAPGRAAAAPIASVSRARSATSADSAATGSGARHVARQSYGRNWVMAG